MSVARDGDAVLVAQQVLEQARGSSAAAAPVLPSPASSTAARRCMRKLFATTCKLPAASRHRVHPHFSGRRKTDSARRARPPARGRSAEGRAARRAEPSLFQEEGQRTARGERGPPRASRKRRSRAFPSQEEGNDSARERGAPRRSQAPKARAASEAERPFSRTQERQREAERGRPERVEAPKAAQRGEASEPVRKETGRRTQERALGLSTGRAHRLGVDGLGSARRADSRCTSTKAVVAVG